MKNCIHQLRIPILLALTFLTTELSPAATIIWNGASGTDTNWSTAGNWIGGVAPASIDDAKFYDDGAAAPGTTNNVVNSSFSGSIRTLQYGQTNNTHNTLIESGKTLTVLGNFIVGTEGIAAQNIDVAIAGEGATLVVSNSSAVIFVRQGGEATSRRATLDLSALDTFIMDVSQLIIGRADPAGVPNINRNTGWVYLAKTNRLRAASATATSSSEAIELGRSGSNNGNGSRLYLGQTNAIFASGLGIGLEKETACAMLFNPVFTSPVAYFRGADGTSRMSFWTIGDGEANTGTTTCRGTNDFTGGTVDAQVDTLTVGRAGTGGTGANISIGMLVFEAGTINVNTLQVGLQTTANVKGGDGTVNVNGTGTLMVNSSLQIGQASGSTGAALTRGVLNINGGTVRANSIITGVGSAASLINVTTGTLIVTNTAGTPAVPLGDLSLSDSTLRLGTITPSATNVVVTNLTTGGSGNVINIGLLGGITGFPAQITLIQYVNLLGSGDNFTITGLPPAYTGFLSNNTTFSSFDLVITSGPVPQAVKWNGLPNGNWDTSTANWRVGATSTNYNEGDFTTFDDTASGTTTVNLTAALLPGSVTVNNNSLSYTFTGSGSIGGLGGLTKQGSGSLVIDNNGGNSFNGPISVSGGTLQIGNGGTSGNLGAGTLNNSAALIFNRSDDLTVANVISGSAAGTLTKNGAGVLTLSAANTFTGTVTVAQGTLKTSNNSALGRTNGATTVNSGATLDIGANAINLGQEPVSVSGSGVGGNGAIINSSGSPTFVNANVARVTMTGNTTFGGTGRWDLRSATTTDPSQSSLLTGGQPYTLIKKGNNQVSIVGVTVDPALGDVDVQAGILAIEAATTGLGNPANNLVVQAGATLQFFNLTNQFNKVITLNGTGTNNTVNNSSGANTVIGPITLSGDTIFNAGGTSLTLSNTISGSGNLIKAGGAPLILTGGNDSYTGNTTVSNGTLLVNNIVTGGGTLTTLTNTTLGGTGTNTGAVIVGGTLAPGTSAGTFGCGSLTLNAGATLIFELNSVNTIGSDVNDLLEVSGTLTPNNNSISVGLLGGSLQTATYRLINYSGSLAGSFNPTVSLAGGASRYGFALDTLTAGQVNVAVTGSPGALRWDATGSSAWDIATSTNWFNTGTSAPDAFFQADSVLFNDAPGLQTIVDIGPGIAVGPSSVTVTSDNNAYTIAGAGRIIGGASIVKNGTSTLTLGSTNSHSGGLTVNSGAVRLTGINAAGGGLITVNNGATLIVSAAHTNSITLAGGTLGVDVADFVMATSSQLTVPVSTTATIQSSDPQNPVTSRNIQVDGTLRGSGNILVKNADNILSPDGNQGVRFRGTGASDYSGTITVANNSKGEMRTSVAGPFSPAGTGKFILNCGAYDGGNTLTGPGTGGYLEFNLRNNTTGDTVLGNDFEITGSGAVMFNPLSDTPAPSNAVTTLGNLRIGGGQELIVYKGAGNPYTLKFQSVTLTGGNVTFTPKSPTFGAVAQTGSDLALGNINQTAASGITVAGLRTLTLTGTNGYTGDTTITSGTLALTGSSSLTNSPNISLTAGSTLDVSGRTDGKLLLRSGQSSTGIGTIRGSLQVNAGATVAPGSPTLGVPVAALTVTNVVTLAGTTTMEIDKPGLTNDVIDGAASIQYGGTLNVVLLNDQFAAGDSFKLFNAGSYSGSFAITPSAPGAGLAWDTSALTTSGTLKVATATAPVNPQIQNIAASGGNIIISGLNGTQGNDYYVLASTNVALPLSNWTRLQTNQFGVGGSFSFTNAITPDVPRRFYLLQLP